MNILGWNIPRAVEFTLAAVATLGIGALVAADGRMPSPFTTLFFLPIILVAYRQPLGLSLAITVVATFFSSPALAVLGAKVDDSVMPVLWLGWPAV
ncbi:MAG TPA: hypothetical protein VFT91_03605, partial [Dehalococcoidia bacterium]|nr:hypothetical protein [Dehalococcoidia bacterium]